MLAPEPKTSLARIVPAARQPTRTIATALSVASSSRRPSSGAAGAEDDRGAEGAQRRGEAEPVGEDQAGKGGGADRVGEEGEPAQDDPGAEQPGGHGEDQDLEQPTLDEGQLEGLEHETIKSK